MKNAIKVSLLGLALLVGMSVSAQTKKAEKAPAKKALLKPASKKEMTKTSAKTDKNSKKEEKTASKKTTNAPAAGKKKGLAVNEQGSTKTAAAKENK